MSDPFGALTTQRKGDIGFFDGVQWQTSTSAATDSFMAQPAHKIQLLDGNLGTPISTTGATFKVSRTEMFAVAPPFDPQYNGAIFASTYSQTGNKAQPTAIGGVGYGYAEGSALITSGFFSSQQVSGANVGGNYGGALGVYAAALSTLDHGAIQGIEVSVYNGTTLDGDPAVGAQAGIDLVVGGAKRFANGYQVRAGAGGGDTMFKALADTGDWLTGISLKDATLTGTTPNYIEMLANWSLSTNSGNVLYVVQSLFLLHCEYRYFRHRCYQPSTRCPT